MLVRILGGILLITIPVIWYLRTTNVTLRTELSLAEANIQSCNQRVTNIIEDKESDDQIDNLTDDQLIDIPPEWLRR